MQTTCRLCNPAGYPFVVRPCERPSQAIPSPFLFPQEKERGWYIGFAWRTPQNVSGFKHPGSSFGRSPNPIVCGPSKTARMPGRLCAPSTCSRLEAYGFIGLAGQGPIHRMGFLLPKENKTISLLETSPTTRSAGEVRHTPPRHQVPRSGVPSRGRQARFWSIPSSYSVPSLHIAHMTAMIFRSVFRRA